jgi:hypothetical protein
LVNVETYSEASVLFAIPVIKLSENIDAFGSRGPFLVLEVVIFAMNSVFQVAFRYGLQATLTLELLDPFLGEFPKFFEDILEISVLNTS